MTTLRRIFGPSLHLEVARTHRDQVGIGETRQAIVVAEERDRVEARHVGRSRVAGMHRLGDLSGHPPPIGLREIDHRQIAVGDVHRLPRSRCVLHAASASYSRLTWRG